MKKISAFLVIIFSLSFCGNEKNYHKISQKPLQKTEFLQIGLINKEKGGEKIEMLNDNVFDNGNYIGQYKIGEIYQISGNVYQPQKYNNFEEVGMASWYGDDFHGKRTANNELYHKGDMTAAHPTLPLPSMVRITNLDNGKSVKVRVNDRGPFSKKRIVDVSEEAAKQLGFRNKGIAHVKLEFLKEDTEDLLNQLNLAK